MFALKVAPWHATRPVAPPFLQLPFAPFQLQSIVHFSCVCAVPCRVRLLLYTVSMSSKSAWGFNDLSLSSLRVSSARSSSWLVAPAPAPSTSSASLERSDKPGEKLCEHCASGSPVGPVRVAEGSAAVPQLKPDFNAYFVN